MAAKRARDASGGPTGSPAAMYAQFESSKPLIELPTGTPAERAKVLSLTGVTVTPLPQCKTSRLGATFTMSEVWAGQISRKILQRSDLLQTLRDAELHALHAFVESTASSCAFLYDGDAYCSPHFDKELEPRLFIRLVHGMAVHYLMLEPPGGAAVFNVRFEGSFAYEAHFKLFFDTKHCVPSPRDAVPVMTLLFTLRSGDSSASKLAAFLRGLNSDMRATAELAWHDPVTHKYQRCLRDLTEAQRAAGREKLMVMYLRCDGSALSTFVVDMMDYGGYKEEDYIKGRVGDLLILDKSKVVGDLLTTLHGVLGQSPRVRPVGGG